MEHEHVTLQSSEDYQELFERFLSAAGIRPAEFKAYLAASVCLGRKWKNIWQYTTPACLQRQS